MANCPLSASMRTMVGSDTIQGHVAAKVAAAWGRYLLSTQSASRAAYEPLEELAWDRLRRELARLGRPLPDKSGRQAGP